MGQCASHHPVAEGLRAQSQQEDSAHVGAAKDCAEAAAEAAAEKAKQLFHAGKHQGAASLRFTDKLALAEALAGGLDRSHHRGDRSVRGERSMRYGAKDRSHRGDKIARRDDNDKSVRGNHGGITMQNGHKDECISSDYNDKSVRGGWSGRPDCSRKALVISVSQLSHATLPGSHSSLVTAGGQACGGVGLVRILGGGGHHSPPNGDSVAAGGIKEDLGSSSGGGGGGGGGGSGHGLQQGKDQDDSAQQQGVDEVTSLDMQGLDPELMLFGKSQEQQGHATFAGGGAGGAGGGGSVGRSGAGSGLSSTAPAPGSVAGEGTSSLQVSGGGGGGGSAAGAYKRQHKSQLLPERGGLAGLEDVEEGREDGCSGCSSGRAACRTALPRRGSTGTLLSQHYVGPVEDEELHSQGNKGARTGVTGAVESWTKGPAASADVPFLDATTDPTASLPAGRTHGSPASLHASHYPPPQPANGGSSTPAGGMSRSGPGGSTALSATAVSAAAPSRRYLSKQQRPNVDLAAQPKRPALKGSPLTAGPACSLGSPVSQGTGSPRNLRDPSVSLPVDLFEDSLVLGRVDKQGPYALTSSGQGLPSGGGSGGGSGSGEAFLAGAATATGVAAAGQPQSQQYRSRRSSSQSLQVQLPDPALQLRPSLNTPAILSPGARDGRSPLAASSPGGGSGRTFPASAYPSLGYPSGSPCPPSPGGTGGVHGVAPVRHNSTNVSAGSPRGVNDGCKLVSELRGRYAGAAGAAGSGSFWANGGSGGGAAGGSAGGGDDGSGGESTCREVGGLRGMGLGDGGAYGGMTLGDEEEDLLPGGVPPAGS